MEYLSLFLYSALPLFILSFLLVYWAIKHQYISVDDEAANLKELKKNYKTAEQGKSINRIHKKWLFFGGGFYGLMAFITYIHVEFFEVYEFIMSYTTFSNLIEQLTIKAIIGLIIDSFLNLIPAFTWFLYWPKQIVMHNSLYWLIAAYLGYQLGSKFAQWWVKTYGLNLFVKDNRTI